MADEIKAAFKVRSVAKSKFTRAETILNEALGATDIPVATIQRRFDDLKKCWTAVQAAHDEYIFSVEQKPEDVTQPADHLLEPYIDELVIRNVFTHDRIQSKFLCMWRNLTKVQMSL